MNPSIKYHVCFLFFIFSIHIFAQDGLLIRNLKNGKAWMYEKNSRITYIKFGQDEYDTGILMALRDSSIIVGSDTVFLDSIAGIRRKSPAHNIARIAGMPLMVIGSLLMGQGGASMITNPDSDSGTKLFLVGAGVFAVGYMPYQINLTDLTVGKKGEWKMEICRGCLSTK